MIVRNALLGLISSGVGAGIWWHVGSFPKMAGMAYGPDFFPRLLAIGFGLTGLTLVASDFFGGPTDREGADAPFKETGAKLINLLRFFGILTALAVFAFLVPTLGFILGCALSVMLAGFVYRASVVQIVILAVMLPLGCKFLFADFLRVTLPRGIVENLIF